MGGLQHCQDNYELEDPTKALKTLIGLCHKKGLFDVDVYFGEGVLTEGEVVDVEDEVFAHLDFLGEGRIGYREGEN